MPTAGLSDDGGTPGSEEAKPPSKFRSPEDGWFDVSAFLDEPGDLRHWKDDRLQTLVGFFDASVNLDFHGIGGGALPEDRALAYNLRPIGGLAQAKYRLGGSRAWVGLSYLFAVTDVTFDAPDGTPGLPGDPRESRVGGITPSLTYDSRDTLFTPSRGTYVEASSGFFGSALGGDDEFERVGLIAMQYLRPHPKLTLGLRLDLGLSFGDAPFYMRPYVSLRGAPVLRYQGEQAASLEAELRWQLWKRFSLVPSRRARPGRPWLESRHRNLRSCYFRGIPRPRSYCGDAGAPPAARSSSRG